MNNSSSYTNGDAFHHWPALDESLTPERRRQFVDETVKKGLQAVCEAILDQTRIFTNRYRNKPELYAEVESTVQGWLDSPDEELAMAQASGMLRYLLENGSYVADLAPLNNLKNLEVQRPGMSLVDLGTGSGGVPRAWAKEGSPAMGFDISPSFVEANSHIEYAVIDGDPMIMRRKAYELMNNPAGYTVLSSLTLDRVGRPKQLIKNMSTLAGKEGNLALYTLLPVVPEDDEDVGQKIIYTPKRHRLTETGTELGDKAAIQEYMQDTHKSLIQVVQTPYTVQTTTGEKKYDNYYGFLARGKRGA